MVSHEHKCIFIHIPKCAGTSIENALGHFEGCTGKGRQDHRTIRMLERPLLNSNIFASKENFNVALHRVRYKFTPQENPRNKFTVNKEQYEQYFKFTFVRNPWARAFSWYENVRRGEIHKKALNIVGDLTLEEFLEKYIETWALRPQPFWIQDFNGNIPLDYIGRFENLSKDFLRVCELIDIAPVDLTHEIRGPSVDYREKYTRRSKDIIGKFYQKEIELFDYKFAE